MDAMILVGGASDGLAWGADLMEGGGDTASLYSYQVTAHTWGGGERLVQVHKHTDPILTINDRRINSNSFPPVYGLREYPASSTNER